MMTKLNLMKPILAAVCTALFSFSLSAQVVKNDRLLSFEQPELPAGLSATKATLGISDQHYKDGTHSLRWTFECSIFMITTWKRLHWRRLRHRHLSAKVELYTFFKLASTVLR